jgi:hypothetical protein
MKEIAPIDRQTCLVGSSGADAGEQSCLGDVVAEMQLIQTLWGLNIGPTF